MKACYIHIPFCDKKCYYCDFVTFEKKDGKEKYFEYLKKELSLYPSFKFKSLYFGGGTPSVVDPKLINEIIGLIDIEDGGEITLEFNPERSYFANLKKYIKMGVNRLSIGCQTFDDQLLKKIGRLHTGEEAKEAFLLARKEGFKNINLDLIFALPNQTMEMLQKDLEIIIDLSPEHISIYSLIWKERAKFFEMRKKGLVKEIGEDLEADMYQYVFDFFKKSGYEHYEISSFSKKGFESKHNMTYWRNEEYIGLGLGAAGYIDDLRYTNVKSFAAYYKSLEENRLPLLEEDKVNEERKFEYFLILGLRLLKEGVSLPSIPQHLKDKFIPKLELLGKEGLILNENGTLRLTRRGLFLSNEVFAEIID